MGKCQRSVDLALVSEDERRFALICKSHQSDMGASHEMPREPRGWMVVVAIRTGGATHTAFAK
eukprot:7134188-Pyramimonas_sp.AAC.1